MLGANDFFYLHENIVERQKGVIFAEGLGSLYEPIHDGVRLLLQQHTVDKLSDSLAIHVICVKMS